MADKTNKRVLACGNPANYQLGDGQASYHQKELVPISPKKVDFTFISSAGAYTHMAIDADGAVFAWGLNSSGECAANNTNPVTFPIESRFDRTEVEEPTITFVSTGDGFSHALDDKGNLWATGSNANGQLANGTIGGTQQIFKRSMANTTFTMVSSGAMDNYANPCCLAISKEHGQLYGWGYSDRGILGNGQQTAQYTTPTLIPTLDIKKWTWVSHHQKAAAAIADSGEIYTWGERYAGILGDGKAESGYVTRPTRLSILDNAGNDIKFTKVSVGAYHMMALDAGKNIWVWGTNGEYCLGQVSPLNTPVYCPRMMELIRGSWEVVDIAAGYNCSAAVSDTGQVLAWGKNGSYQLSQEGNLVPISARVASLRKQKATKVAFGASSMFVLA